MSIMNLSACLVKQPTLRKRMLMKNLSGVISSYLITTLSHAHVLHCPYKSNYKLNVLNITQLCCKIIILVANVLRFKVSIYTYM